MSVSGWVDEQLKELAPGEAWRPNAVRALARFRERRARARRQRRGWRFLAGGVCAAAVLLLTVPPPQACAQRRWGIVCIKPAAVAMPAAAVTQPTPVIPQVKTPPAAPSVAAAKVAPAPVHFKESGSASAPITCEIYSDYECPHCARLYFETIPQLVTEYVRTGRVRMIHRDFPLPTHPWARLAARYANAAGEIGQYELAVDRIFRTQSEWGKNGDVDRQLAQVLTPGDMERVRALVKDPARIDAGVDADLQRAIGAGLNQTPTMVFTRQGRRVPIAGDVTFPVLRKFLDELK